MHLRFSYWYVRIEFFSRFWLVERKSPPCFDWLSKTADFVAKRAKILIFFNKSQNTWHFISKNKKDEKVKETKMTIPKVSRSDPETVLLMDESDSNLDMEQNPVELRAAPTRSKSQSSTASDFALIKIIARLTLQMIRRFWAFSSAGALAIILFYWLCGGFVAFSFVAFAITGNSVFLSNVRNPSDLKSKSLTI